MGIPLGVCLESESLDGRTAAPYQEVVAEDNGKKPRSATSSTSSEDQALSGDDDFPRTALVNDLLRLMWPNISLFAKQVINKNVEPAVKKALGVLGDHFAFKHENFTLGDHPAMFTDMRAQRAVQKSDRGDITNIVLRSELEWQGTPSIVIVFTATEIGIKAIKISGVVIIELVGLKPRPPMFQGMRVFFINPPRIDIEFSQHSAALSKLLNLSRVKAKVLEALTDQVSKRLVAPNRFSIRIDPTCDIFQITSPMPVGVLRLTVLRAKHLIAMDRAIFTEGSSDPYVLVYCGAEVYKSHTVQESLSPVFDWTVWIPISSLDHQRLRLELYDEDILSADDYLGGLDLPVAEIQGWEKEVCLDLQENVGSHTEIEGLRTQNSYCGCVPPQEDLKSVPCPGQIWLSAEWRPLAFDHSHGTEEGIIQLGVCCVTHVPMEPDPHVYWVEADCSHLLSGAKVRNTKTSMKQQDYENIDKDHGEREALRKVTKSKLDLMRKYNVSTADMAQVLEIDEAILLKGDREKTLGVSGGGKLDFNHCFEFLVETASLAKLTLELKKRPVASTSEETVSKHMCDVGKLFTQPNRCCVETVQLTGSNICLKFRAHFLSLVPAAGSLVRDFPDFP